MPTATAREELLRKVNALPDKHCPAVLHLIEELEKKGWDNEGNDDIDDEEFQEILDGINHRYAKVFQRLRQKERDMDEGRTKAIPFSDKEWDEFCEEFEHSPEEALAKAYSRGHHLTPK